MNSHNWRIKQQGKNISVVQSFVLFSSYDDEDDDDYNNDNNDDDNYDAIC